MSGSGERPGVCIVTSELIGPFNNGGIGTSMTGLASCLAGAGFPVTILYTGGKFSSPAEIEHWRGLYAGLGITLDWIRYEQAANLAGPLVRCGFTAPWLVYLYLTAHRFDVVQFNDCMGEGFYCLTAKRLGLSFAGTAMFVGLHSPSQWIFEINRTLPDSLLFAAFNHAERLSVRAADLLWSPSRYLIDWSRAHGFVLPPATLLQKYALPPIPLFGPARVDEPPTRARLFPREIAFFGRLEERKGLRLFCQTLRLIEPLLVERRISVTFLGKAGTVGDGSALDFLEEEGRDWRFAWSVRTNLGQQEAVDHIVSGSAFAVMASPADNSPCTVYEALAHGIPFLAARTGGIPELIAERDREAVLFDYRPEALAAKLAGAMAEGLFPARPAEDPAETRRLWIGRFEQWREFAATPIERESERRLCVLVDGEDGADLTATMASLDVPEVGRVLLIGRRWRQDADAAARDVVRIPPGDRQLFLEALGGDEGEAILALRAGTILLPGAARRLLEALRRPEVDGLVPAALTETANGARTMPPLGGSPSFCLFEGASPPGAMAIKAERLGTALAGYALPADAEHLGLADRAIAAGLEIWPFPEPLIRHPRGFVAEAGNRRAPERVAAYALVASPTERFYIAAIGYGGFMPQASLGHRLRDLREWMVTRRLGWAVRGAYRIIPRRLLTRLQRLGTR
jgi:glycosyltransferase involved in cell wall biosynthesis